MRTLFLSLAFVLATACGAADTDTDTDSTQPAKVLWHATPEAAVAANAYLVEGADGVVAVDTTLTVTEAHALRAKLDATSKPLLAVLLSHGHPDHYNGAAILVAGKSAPIIATAGVDQVVREYDAAKEAQWTPVFGDEWPAERAFPTRIVKDGERVKFGDLSFVVHDLGPGESHHDSYWVLEGPAPAVFVGDLLFSGVHSYVADGHTAAWLASLDRVARDVAGIETVYPGHGKPGGSELFAAQRGYLETYRDNVARLAGGATSLDEAAEQELTQVMSEYLGSESLGFLIALGADAVAAELAAAVPQSSR